MNSPRESMGAAAFRILSRMRNRPRVARPRRFRPLAEPMEARAVLSHVVLPHSIVAPIATGHGPSAIAEGQSSSPDVTSAGAGLALVSGMAGRAGLGINDAVEVNGQVEIQPGDTSQS